MIRYIDMAGKIIGNWKILRLDLNKSGKTKYWICECQCEYKTIKSVNGSSLRSGESTRCKLCWLDNLHLENKLKFVGENNPFYGKSHSEETRKMMSDNHADFTGENNPLLNAIKKNPSILEKCSRIRKDWYKNASEETLIKRSERLSFSMANSEYHKSFSSLKNHKSGHFITKNGNVTFYRSSWEEKILISLNNMNRVVELKCEPFTIKYINKSGKVRYTRPDIYVKFDNGIILIIEIKPLALLKYRDNIEKIKAQINHCKTNNFVFRLLTDKFIKDEELFLRTINFIVNSL